MLLDCSNDWQVSVSAEKVCVYDCQTNSVRREFHEFASVVFAQISGNNILIGQPDSIVVVFPNRDSQRTIYSVADSKILSGKVTKMDESILVIGLSNSTVEVIEVKTGQVIKRLGEP